MDFGYSTLIAIGCLNVKDGKFQLTRKAVGLLYSVYGKSE